MRTCNCQGCGKPLVKPRRDQLYHNDTCKHTVYRARDALEKPASVPPSHVVLAGVDTLYMNAYYADPEVYTRVDRALDETLQETFTTMQQQARATHQDVETSWSLDEEALHMLSHGSVQEILGHSQISMTLDVYSHVLPSTQKDVTKRWDDDFGAGVPVPIK